MTRFERPREGSFRVWLRRVPLRAALEFRLQPFGLTYVVDGNAVLVATIADVAVTLTTSNYDATKIIAALGDADSVETCITRLVDCPTWTEVGGTGMLRFFPDGRQLVVTKTHLGTTLPDTFAVVTVDCDVHHFLSTEPRVLRRPEGRPATLAVDFNTLARDIATSRSSALDGPTLGTAP